MQIAGSAFRITAKEWATAMGECPQLTQEQKVRWGILRVILVGDGGSSAIEFVDYGDVRVDFYRMAIEEGGFVTPLAHGV